MKQLSLSSLLDVMVELFSEEVSIAITNKHEYVYYRRSKRIDLKIHEGDPIKKGTLAHKAITTNKKVSEFIDRNIYGVPYHGMAVPYYNEDEMEGCVLAIYPAYTEGKSVITVRSQDGWKPIPFSELIYLEAKERKTYAVAQDYAGFHTNTLQEFEFMLPTNVFIRCHRSYIVNVNNIEEIYPDTHSTFMLGMKNGEQVPVSQSYSSYFRKLLGF